MIMKNEMLTSPEVRLHQMIVGLWNRERSAFDTNMAQSIDSDKLAALLTLAEAALNAGTGSRIPSLVQDILRSGIESAEEKLVGRR